MYDGPIIDSDVHHNWRSDAEVVEYLPKKWREFIDLPQGRQLPLVPSSPFVPLADGVYHRLDAFPPNGGPPGSDYETMRRQLLDPLNIEHAVLSYDVGVNVGVRNVFFASALTRAINDWSIDRWLSMRDERINGAVLVPTQLPEDAAAEIRRVGTHPRMVEALLVVNGLGKPFGHPLYHPIYEAAAELGIPVAIHTGGERQLAPSSQWHAGGQVGSRVEFYNLFDQSAQHHLVSFITHGVFEKYRDLRVIFVEYGFAWLPYLVWELDNNYAGLRSESPWVKRLPSDYVREHVRFTTQPFDMSPEKGQLIQLLEAFGGMEDILMFATDYAHDDADTARHVASRLPESWWDKVFYENAAKFYGWPSKLPARNGHGTD